MAHPFPSTVTRWPLKQLGMHTAPLTLQYDIVASPQKTTHSRDEAVTHNVLHESSRTASRVHAWVLKQSCLLLQGFHGARLTSFASDYYIPLRNASSDLDPPSMYKRLHPYRDLISRFKDTIAPVVNASVSEWLSEVAKTLKLLSKHMAADVAGEGRQRCWALEFLIGNR